MTSLTIKLPTRLKEQVEAEARLSGKSVSALVRASLEKRVEQKQKIKSTLYERTKDLCGIGDSGIVDLATHPQKYMEGFGKWRK